MWGRFPPEEPQCLESARRGCESGLTHQGGKLSNTSQPVSSSAKQDDHARFIGLEGINSLTNVTYLAPGSYLITSSHYYSSNDPNAIKAQGRDQLPRSRNYLDFKSRSHRLSTQKMWVQIHFLVVYPWTTHLISEISVPSNVQ